MIGGGKVFHFSRTLLPVKVLNQNIFRADALRNFH
jgi:hypothetical protein